MRGSGTGGSFPERCSADCRASPGSDSLARSEPLSHTPTHRKEGPVPAPRATAPAQLRTLASRTLAGLTDPHAQPSNFSLLCFPLLMFGYLLH